MKSELNGEERRIKLKGLKADSKYINNDKAYYGEELMKLGLRIAFDSYEYNSNVIILKELKIK